MQRRSIEKPLSMILICRCCLCLINNNKLQLEEVSFYLSLTFFFPSCIVVSFITTYDIHQPPKNVSCNYLYCNSAICLRSESFLYWMRFLSFQYCFSLSMLFNEWFKRIWARLLQFEILIRLLSSLSLGFRLRGLVYCPSLL